VICFGGTIRIIPKIAGINAAKIKFRK